jgi:CheY-like chemotaxis protein
VSKQSGTLALLWSRMSAWVLASAVCFGSFAHAQDWPQRPVRIIAPYAAGGNSDVLARLTAQRLSDAFGQQFIVENRVGGNGMIAAEAVARSPADGYTVLWGALPPIAIVVATNPFVLVVNKTIPVNSVAAFIAWVRAQPSKVGYAEGGVGSVTHLAMAIFLKRAGLEMVNVSYRGNAPALTDIVAGPRRMNGRTLRGSPLRAEHLRVTVRLNRPALRQIKTPAAETWLTARGPSLMAQGALQAMMTEREPPNAKPVVIVVDDDGAVRNSLKFSLEIEGFAVHTYADSEQLLQGEELANSSCLVIDHNMPGMTGLDAVAKLRQRHVLVPAILITTLPSVATAERARKAEIPIVEKPLLLENGLLDHIQAALASSRLSH